MEKGSTNRIRQSPPLSHPSALSRFSKTPLANPDTKPKTLQTPKAISPLSLRQKLLSRSSSFSHAVRRPVPRRHSWLLHGPRRRSSRAFRRPLGRRCCSPFQHLCLPKGRARRGDLRGVHCQVRLTIYALDFTFYASTAWELVRNAPRERYKAQRREKK